MSGLLAAYDCSYVPWDVQVQGYASDYTTPCCSNCAVEPSDYDSMHVVGDFNGWASGSAMTQVARKVWERTLYIPAGCSLMKFRTNGSADSPPDYGTCTAEDPSCQAPLQGEVCLVSGSGTALGEIDFLNAEYLFRLNEWDMTYEITLIQGIPDIDVSPASLSFQVPEAGTDCSSLTIDNLGDGERERVLAYLNVARGSDVPWKMIEAAYRSPSLLALVPLQDFLGLGSDARMNRPGTTSGNWSWRATAPSLTLELAARLRALGQASGR